MESLSEVITEPVDVIVAGEVIEHVMNPGRALESCAEVLKPGGRLILSTPNPDGFAYWRKAVFGQTGNPTHTCWIDPFNLRRLVSMTDCGFQIHEMTYLPPVGGVSSVLWTLGLHRASSPGYVAELRYEPVDSE
jgi:SAM-dependent methyltransferase